MKAFTAATRLAITIALAISLVPVAPAVAVSSASAAAWASVVPVIVRAEAGSAVAAAAVVTAGGVVTHDLDLIEGVAADIPGTALPWLAGTPGLSVALDFAVQRAGRPVVADVASPANTYLDTTGVRDAWKLKDSTGRSVKGYGVGIAIVDSGVSSDADFSSLAARNSFNPNASSVNDTFGHGTHVAGVAAGNGSSNPVLAGVAPGASIIACRIADEAGNASESDVVAALQWIYENKAKYNIRVVNLSVNSGVAQSYHQSALDAACEILWFNGVVVVASAGNGESGTFDTLDAAPANDPFIITVGATNENGTSSRNDDTVATFSAYGATSDGFAKPDILAPGVNIWSVLSKNSAWPTIAPDRVSPDGEYFRLSGTSMSAPMVAGAVALLLQKEPGLTPDQVKFRLMYSNRWITGPDKVRYPYLDAYVALLSASTVSANTGLPVSTMLTTGTEPVNSSVMWNSVMWNSVMWNSVMWNSVMWNSVMWNSVMWAR